MLRRFFSGSSAGFRALPKGHVTRSVFRKGKWIRGVSPIISRLVSTAAAEERGIRKRGIFRPKTSIKFTLGDQAGSLQEALGYFAQHDVSLTRIESRPSKKTSDYEFYVDFHADSNDPNVENLLRVSDGVLGSSTKPVSAELVFHCSI